MIVSLTPLKLLNLAQLALISKLLLNKNAPTGKMASEAPEQKVKGNVMIFLGKHTVQLAPDKSDQQVNRASSTLVPPDRAVRPNAVTNKISPPKASRYQNRSLSGLDLDQATKQRPVSLLRHSEQHVKKMPPSQVENIYYLPYSTRHNKIQFFDFERDLLPTSTHSPSEQTFAHHHQRLQTGTVLNRLFQGKNPPSPAVVDSKNQTPVDREEHLSHWLRNILQSSSEERNETDSGSAI